jgi:hypothetical protein
MNDSNTAALCAPNTIHPYSVTLLVVVMHALCAAVDAVTLAHATVTQRTQSTCYCFELLGYHKYSLGADSNKVHTHRPSDLVS